MNNHNVSVIARKDISKYLNEKGNLANTNEKERWNISLEEIFSSKQRVLNKFLGLPGLNKKRNKNNIKK